MPKKIKIFILLFIVAIGIYFYVNKNNLSISSPFLPKDEKINLLFTGDIFLDRGIDFLSQKSDLKYSYPFQGLSTFNKSEYNLWVGNLECPVTDEQSTRKDKEVYLRFSCKKEYLPELSKYFDIVSLANNHTDNMGKGKGIGETRKHLEIGRAHV